jgi:hypothetical protein
MKEFIIKWFNGSNDRLPFSHIDQNSGFTLGEKIAIANMQLGEKILIEKDFRRIAEVERVA